MLDDRKEARTIFPTGNSKVYSCTLPPPLPGLPIPSRLPSLSSSSLPPSPLFSFTLFFHLSLSSSFAVLFLSLPPSPLFSFTLFFHLSLSSSFAVLFLSLPPSPLFSFTLFFHLSLSSSFAVLFLSLPPSPLFSFTLFFHLSLSCHPPCRSLYLSISVV